MVNKTKSASTNILFVCTGNTCRSPMAQIIFDNLCKRKGRRDIKITSAGLFTIDGMPQTITAVEALIHCGEKLGRKTIKSTLFKPEMIRKQDYIITMSGEHAKRIGDFEHVKSLNEFTGCGEILDPFGQKIDVYIECCKKLQVALSSLYDILFALEVG